MSEDALRVVADAITYHPGNRGLPLDRREVVSAVLAETILRDLGANGYVVVPRHLLDELLAVTAPASNGKLYTAAIAEVRAAVVEAVGPTREDQR